MRVAEHRASENQALRNKQKRSFRWTKLLGAVLALLLFGRCTHSMYRGLDFGAQPVDFDYTKLPAGSLRWWPCKGKGDTEGAECGYIIVPTDYFDGGAGVRKIALGRYKATKSPRKGMILFNPGGPGGPGKPQATMLGPQYQTLYGEDYDFIGFDPRGVGETEPSTQCFGPGQFDAFRRNTVLDRGFDVGGDLASPDLRDRPLQQQREARALYQTQFALCGKVMGDALKYMGTSTVVRDIDFMTKVLEGPDALINFAGGSYGSILGQYLVNMLPRRVGRVVISGIADAAAWSNTPNLKWYREMLSSTEGAYLSFLAECFKEGDESPLAIRNRVERFFNELYERPIAVSDSSLPGILTAGRARNFLFVSLQSPRRWPLAAGILAEAMQGNGSALLGRSVVSLYRDMERQAVSCNDAVPVEPGQAPSSEEVIDELMGLLANVTRFAASVVTTEPDSGCEFWPVRPPERFTGPWNRTLSNPILIHSNEEDPITPLSSARLVKERLGDSARIVIREGPGHGFFSLASLCSFSITRAYFADGTLPDDGCICPADEAPFPRPDQMGRFSDAEKKMLEAVAVLRDAEFRSISIRT